MSYPIILAIDYGTVRIGLAISRGSLAEPLKILPSDDTALSQILALCQEEQVQRIVVGLSENQMAQKTLAFIDRLKTMTQLPIETVDETLSSHTVHQQQLESGMKLTRRQAPIDHLAAASFLQEYLDFQNND